MIKSEKRTRKVRDVFKKVLRPGILGLICLVSVTSANTPDSTSFKAAADEATQLIKQVDKLNYEGKYLQAVPLAEKAVAIRERIFGKEHIETAAALDTLCYSNRQAGRFREAQIAIERALPIRERALGATSLETATSLNNLGSVQFLLGNTKEAKATYVRALAIRQHQLGQSHPDTLLSANNLALLYSVTGKIQNARELLNDVVRRSRPSYETHALVLRSALSTLASLHCDFGDFASAEALAEEALEIGKAKLPPEHPVIGDALSLLATIYYLSGAYVKAEDFFLRGLAVRENALGPDHPFVAKSLGRLGSLYARIGNYAKAEQTLVRSLHIRERTIGSESREVASSLNNLGEVYALDHQAMKAKNYFSRSLALKQSNPGSPEFSQAITLHNLGVINMMLGDFEQSEVYLKDALVLRRKYLESHHPLLAETLIAQANLQWLAGNRSSALDALRQADEIRSKYSKRILRFGSELRRREFLDSISEDANRLVTFSLLDRTTEFAVLGLSAVFSVKGRALEAASDSINRLRSTLDSDDRRIFDELKSISSELSNSAYTLDTLEKPHQDLRITELTRSLEDLDAVLALKSPAYRNSQPDPKISEIKSQIPDGSALIEWFKYRQTEPKSLNVNGKQGAPYGTFRYIAYVVRSDRDVHSIDMGDAETIDSAIKRFREAISNADTHDTFVATEALSKLIFIPMEKDLNKISHLLIAPDGLLNLMPFGALVDSQDNILNRRFEISYLSSGRDLVRRRQSGTSSNAMIVANPSFGATSAPIPYSRLRSSDLDRGGFIFRPLENSEFEATHLRRIIGTASTTLIGAEATEQAIKQVRGPKILHIASHGFFLSDQEFNTEVRKKVGRTEESPISESPLLRSGLALAGANERRSGRNEDGILTALEVAQLDLSGTELVVLSACDTGLGEIKNGEGVYGLRRALVLAGAESQVTSLWKVSDEATRILMVSFYEKLLKGEGRSEALRHAQLELMNNSKYSHPYYWASFLPIGDWTPLKSIQPVASQARVH